MTDPRTDSAVVSEVGGAVNGLPITENVRAEIVPFDGTIARYAENLLPSAETAVAPARRNMFVAWRHLEDWALKFPAQVWVWASRQKVQQILRMFPGALLAAAETLETERGTSPRMLRNKPLIPGIETKLVRLWIGWGWPGDSAVFVAIGSSGAGACSVIGAALRTSLHAGGAVMAGRQHDETAIPDDVEQKFQPRCHCASTSAMNPGWAEQFRCSRPCVACNQSADACVVETHSIWRTDMMKKALAVLATAGTVAATALAAPAPAEARGIGPGLAFGLAAGALTAGAIAASHPYYGYGPGYGYYYGPSYAYGPGPYAYYGGPYYHRHHYWRHYW